MEEQIRQYLEKRNLVHFEVSLLPLNPTEKVLISYNAKSEDNTHLIKASERERFHEIILK